MTKTLSDSQERAITTMSGRGGGSRQCIEQGTLRSLEKAKLIGYAGDRWKLTEAGKFVAAALRKYKPTGALAGLLEKHQEFNRDPMEVRPHDLRYMAEKMRELFGPVIDECDESKAEFLRVLGGVNTRQTNL